MLKLIKRIFRKESELEKIARRIERIGSYVYGECHKARDLAKLIYLLEHTDMTNTLLHTRDGRKIGNAIVVEHDYSVYQLVIKTDYGNVLILGLDEIVRLYHIGNAASETHKYYTKCQTTKKD